MSLLLDAWTDFTCPYCFLATLAVEQLNAHYELDLRWRAFQLRPPGASHLPYSTPSRATGEHDHVASRVLSEFGLKLKPGPPGISTRLAHIATAYAFSIGRGDSFHLLAMNHYWLDGNSIESPRDIHRLAEIAGLDPLGVTSALENPAFADLVDADRQEANRFGLQGVPALLFSHKYLISGAHPYDFLQQAVEKLHPESSASAASHA
jgi:predicted DsbA family dithiol-disulfide isomerase